MSTPEKVIKNGIEKLLQELKKRDEELDVLTKILLYKDDKIDDLEDILVEKDEEIIELQIRLDEAEGLIENMQKVVETLDVNLTQCRSKVIDQNTEALKDIEVIVEDVLEAKKVECPWISPKNLMKEAEHYVLEYPVEGIVGNMIEDIEYMESEDPQLLLKGYSCYFFIHGKCRFGLDCLFLHELEGLDSKSVFGRNCLFDHRSTKDIQKDLVEDAV